MNEPFLNPICRIPVSLLPTNQHHLGRIRGHTEHRSQFDPYHPRKDAWRSWTRKIQSDHLGSNSRTDRRNFSPHLWSKTLTQPHLRRHLQMLRVSDSLVDFCGISKLEWRDRCRRPIGTRCGFSSRTSSLLFWFFFCHECTILLAQMAKCHQVE